MSEDKRVSQLYCLMQPTRQKIIKTLQASEKPLYINEIAKKIGASARNTSFHLTELLENGFVDGEYRENKQGHASKYYWITDEVEKAKKEIIKLL